jgi:4-amino-4-deoxy-L-arabinose transferase-like glycosyltransferase
LYALWKALLKPECTRRWVIVYVLLGLSVLAKGPVAILFYALVFGLYAVAVQRDWRLLLRSKPHWGLAIILAITLPWALAVNSRVPGVLQYMIVNENLKRVVDLRWPPDYSVVKVSPLEFLVVALIWLAPWSLILPPVVANTRERARGGGGSERIGVWILALGALIPTMVFLPMPSRLIYYCLPTVPPFAVLAAAWWNASDADEKKVGRVAVGVVFALVGAVIFSAAYWVPPLLKGIPDLVAAPATITLIDDMAMLLGTSIFLGGVLLLVKSVGIGALVLMGGIGFSCIYTSSGFVSFDAVRSSRNLVRAVDSKLGTSAIWISEGSKEIGATAGITYYLTSDDPKKYRTVLVMEDDPRRPPPGFPPPKPAYLIDRKKLNELWTGETPVVFVTDFQRQKWTPEEAPYLPDKAGEPVRLEGTGFRKLYANEAARKKLELK